MAEKHLEVWYLNEDRQYHIFEDIEECSGERTATYTIFQPPSSEPHGIYSYNLTHIADISSDRWRINWATHISLSGTIKTDVEEIRRRLKERWESGERNEQSGRVSGEK